MTHSNSSRHHPLAGLEPGSRFGSYDVIRCIGVGGMGSIFEATHRLMGRRVALKVLHAHGNADGEGRARFMREGATLVRVEHPHIVSVYDAGEIDGVPFLAMELLIGTTLDRVLDREGILAPARAVALLGAVADGLAEAHGAGIVHRDVKPENLFVTTGADGREVLKLVDFGIAKDVRASGASKNTMIGTPDYMAPEQLLDSSPVDGRTDQYALGVVLYQALTGIRPFVAESVLGLAMLLERGEPPLPPSARGVLVGPALDRAVLRALSIEPGARFTSIAAFATALRDSLVPAHVHPRPAEQAEASADEADVPPEPRALGPVPTRAPTLVGVEETTRSQRSRVRRATLVLAALGLLTMAGVALARRTQRPPPRAPRAVSMSAPVRAEQGPEPASSSSPSDGEPTALVPHAMTEAGDVEAPGTPSPQIPRRSRPARAHVHARNAQSDPTPHPPTVPPVLRLER